MICDRKIFSKVQEQEGGMLVELGDNVKRFSQEEGFYLDGLMHEPPVLNFSINEIRLALGCSEFSSDINS